MKQLEFALSEATSQHSANRSRKVVVWVCLVVSLTLHIAAISALFLSSSQRGYTPTATYIDLDSVAGPAPPAVAEIHAPPPPAQEVKKVQAMPEPAPDKVPALPAAEHPATPAKLPESDIRATPLGRGMANGYFSSFGEGKNLRDDIREYYFVLLEQINSKWWSKAETLKETAVHDGVVLIVIGRDGSGIDLALTKSTGSREVDRAIVEVLRDAAPFPPLPASYALDIFRAPLRIAAPLHLFGIKNLR
jgi:protein TonB